MQPSQSALVVTVPEAEPVVGRWRASLDRAAGWGVPAHVTVLYPFLPPAELDDEVHARLAAAVATVPGFAATFGRVEWFDDDVVWLAPEPAEPFGALTRAAMAAFPGVRPYEGAHGDDPVPHLTVGDHGGLERLRRAEQDIAPRLPITARVGAVSLLTGSPRPDGWSERARFALG